MGPIRKLETQLDELLHRKAPVQLPENARKVIARALWWLALAFGVLQLLAAWSLWRAGERADELVDFANSISIYASDPVESLGFFFYFSLALLVVGALILLAAFQGLKEFKKRGWDLLFYGLLLNVAAGAVMIFAEYGGGVGDFIMSLIVSGVGAYFLFQVRDYFTGTKHAGAMGKVEKAHNKTARS